MYFNLVIPLNQPLIASVCSSRDTDRMNGDVRGVVVFYRYMWKVSIGTISIRRQVLAVENVVLRIVASCFQLTILDSYSKTNQ